MDAMLVKHARGSKLPLARLPDLLRRFGKVFDCKSPSTSGKRREGGPPRRQRRGQNFIRLHWHIPPYSNSP